MEEDLFMVLCLSTKNDLVMEVGILVGEDFNVANIWNVCSGALVLCCRQRSKYLECLCGDE